MTLILKITSHNTASHYILLQDFAFKQEDYMHGR